MVPYLQLLFGSVTLAAIYSVFKSLLYNMHIFQLNGYRFSTHSGWLKKNLGRFAVEYIVFALSFTGLISHDPIMGFSAVALLVSVIAVAVENRNKPQKKPLVYTPRVKRMFVTSVVIYVLLFAAAVYCLTTDSKNTAFLVVGLSVALTPFVPIVANVINKPVEKSVNRYYLNDAKKMLKMMPELETIGITGSYGKTSVKFYLYTILRAWTDTLVTPSSFNTPMGIVITIRKSLKAVHKIFLCEMGAKWVGDIKELCDIVHPKHGIITALGEQHLESFGSKENIIKTKYELADALPSEGRLYLNFDNEVIRKNLPKRDYISYGTTPDCDYYAFDEKISVTGTSFKVKAPDGEVYDFDTKLLGSHNVVNITAAVAAANGFGMPMSEMKRYVRRIDAVPHRMQIVNKGEVTIIDDAFNSNPAGCRAALATLRQMDGERILVTPGMVELGSEEYKLNKEFGEFAAECCDRIVLIGKKQTLPIKEGIESRKFPADKLLVFEEFTEAMKTLYAMKTDKKKIILLENDLPDNY
ncbi:MAG: UDP-N-acetylmuramoyl-tripeptide--D-alanyl-D-alanine ligase [Ruminococcaceae bacterium]|nr:UDP-N-acetylmuramoyl-tripeptide--D-alanyl-D-alanine ligase [Oscillospiraceae bacterium]